jgi:hypothetical protein
MRSAFGIVVFVFVAFASNGQQYDLEMDKRVVDSVLVLDVYIKKTEGADFALGASNFDVLLDAKNLDLPASKFTPGDFDASNDPSSYNPMGMGKEHFLVMNVSTNTLGGGSGKLVSANRSKVGSFEIPITNPCATVSPIWSQGGVAIHQYFKTSSGVNITSGAKYTNPGVIDLDGGVSKTIPTVSFEGGKLKSSSSTNNQWYLDGVLVPGATKQEFVPVTQGKYWVEVAYPCAKNKSLELPVLVSGLSDFSMSYSFGAKPNPFVEETRIGYQLSNGANVKLQLYDLAGVFLLDLESGQKSQGSHEYLFKLSTLGIPAGAYIVKMTVGDKLGALKIVAQK